MRIQIPLVVELTDDQVADYAADVPLPSPVRAKDVVASVQGFAVTAVAKAMDTVGSGAVEVSIKKRT